MFKMYVCFLPVLFIVSVCFGAGKEYEKDIIKTNEGDLEITFIGHGTLMFNFNKTIIHVDPYGKLADYSEMPKADVILVTHEHGDHLDVNAIKEIRTEKTILITNKACEEKTEGCVVMKNGDGKSVCGIKVEAVPAYNIVNKRQNGEPFHPKGVGNGYVITFGDKRIYVAGDTENIPEMEKLKNIDIAFLPMNLPYTMTPEMVADAALKIGPKILYPYHYGDTDTGKITGLLKNNKDIEVRIRNMQ